VESLGILWVVLVFVQAAICALVSTELAHEKGHDTSKWGWYGFLFGPIGVLGAVGLPDRDKVYARSTANVSVEEFGGRVVRDDRGVAVGISLVNSRITDSELGQLEELNGLKTLDLGGTRITDAGLSHLAKLVHLETLSLHSTLVTDKGLLHLTGLARLKTLWLGETSVTDRGVAELNRALPECQVSRSG
tara:strand:+ start:2279 stop:2848 length:570 start_codon:yes stop_codon:yes gene_type:complete